MMESAPASPFEMGEVDLAFEFLVVAFDAPAQFGRVDENVDGRVFSCFGALAGVDGTSNMLILNSSNVIPLHTVLAFSNVTEIEDYFGIASPEAAEATTFFSSPPTPKSKLMYARFHLDGGRARVFG